MFPCLCLHLLQEAERLVMGEVVEDLGVDPDDGVPDVDVPGSQVAAGDPGDEDGEVVLPAALDGDAQAPPLPPRQLHLPEGSGSAFLASIPLLQTSLEDFKSFNFCYCFVILGLCSMFNGISISTAWLDASESRMSPRLLTGLASLQHKLAR